MLTDDAPVLPLAVASAAVFVTAAWLLASPDLIVSRAMTWDMLFNLAGAWQLQHGHVPHIDYHDPLGTAGFRLTQLGFLLTGVSIWGFIVGEIVAGAAVCVAAIIVTSRRLPLLPALVFVAYTTLLIVMPTTVGDSVHEITFAMSYNMIGWAALGILSLILFVPPRGERFDGRVDLVIGTALVFALYYVKITYFGAAMIMVPAAILASEPVRERRRRWMVAYGLLAAHSIAPYNWPYLADVLEAVRAGAVNNDIRAQIVRLYDNLPELALVAMAALIVIALWRSSDLSPRLPVAILVMIGTAAAVLSQNTQTQGLTLSVTMAFLLYDHFRGDRSASRSPARLWILGALLVFPLLVLSKQMANMAIYYRQASLGKELFVIERGPLHGLAVPAGRPGLLDAVSRRVVDHTLLNRIREVDTGDQEISQFEYAQTLLEAAALFDSPERRLGGPIALLDQVNPMPFLLQREPPRGGSLWLAPHFPWLPPEQMLGDANYVLVPKFSTAIAVTRTAMERYGAYLKEHFEQRVDSRSWFLYVRTTPRRGRS
jgi:hypothetical protein